VLNIKGEEIIPFKYASLRYIRGGLLVAGIKGKYGILDIEGKIVLPIKCAYGGSINIIPIDKTIIQIEAQEIMNKSIRNALVNTVTVRSITAGILSNGGADALGGFIMKRINIYKQPVQVGDFYYRI